MNFFKNLFKAVSTNGYAIRVLVKHNDEKAALELTNIGVNTIIIQKTKIVNKSGGPDDIREQSIFIKPEQKKELSFEWQELCDGIYLSVKDSTVATDVFLGDFLKDGCEYTYILKNQPVTHPKECSSEF